MSSDTILVAIGDVAALAAALFAFLARGKASETVREAKAARVDAEQAARDAAADRREAERGARVPADREPRSEVPGLRTARTGAD